jgi:hypothetical protein
MVNLALGCIFLQRLMVVVAKLVRHSARGCISITTFLLAFFPAWH